MKELTRARWQKDEALSQMPVGVEVGLPAGEVQKDRKLDMAIPLRSIGENGYPLKHVQGLIDGSKALTDT